MHLVAITSFLAGLVVVIVGAELIVRGGSRVGALLGVSPMILGLTVVAVGTSTPEMAVGLTAAAEGNGGLAVGNIAGTNIVNILFILGLSAWIKPLPLQLLSLKLDLPVMVISAGALLWMAWDGQLSRPEGALMVGAAVAYTIAMVYMSQRESLPIQQEFSREYSASNLLPRVATLQGTVSVLMLAAGIVVVVVGAELLVTGAVDMARSLGVSDAVVGLTIVAIGTSAPELARHKLLDLLGDFALLGVRIKGRVWATRPGHFANTEFMKQLKRTIRKAGEKPRYTYDCRKPALYDINAIRRMLPHRPPFLLVDS